MASVVVGPSRSSSDRLAVDQRKCAQRRHHFVEAVAGGAPSPGAAELFPALGEQETRDRVGASSAAWRSAAPWPASSFAAASMATRKVWHRQPSWYSAGGMARVIQNSRRRSFEAFAVLAE